MSAHRTQAASSPISGSFKLKFLNQVTSPIPYDADATEIKDALNELEGVHVRVHEGWTSNPHFFHPLRESAKKEQQFIKSRRALAAHVLF